MNDTYSKYKDVKSSLRNCDKSSKFYKNTHKDNNFRAYDYCKGIYNKCKSEIDGYTLPDLLQAICIGKLRRDFILEYFTSAIVDVVKINNNKVRTFYKGEFLEKEDAKIIKIGNKKYTRTFEILDENKLGQSINASRYKLILKEQEKYGNTLQIRFKSEIANLRD